MRYTGGKRIGRACVLTLALAIPTIAIGPAGPASAAADKEARPGTSASPVVLAALERDLGLTPDQATQLVRQQVEATKLDQVLQQSLGNDFGGSWFDAKSGKLVVSVTDAHRSAEVTGKGATVRVVQRGKKKLGAITAQLDALAGRPADAARKASPGKRSAALAGVVGWHADPKTDTVVVTAVKGVPKPATLAKYGQAISMEYVDHAPQAAANYMDGGDEIHVPLGTCSAGFNLRNPSTGQGYLLTAGHCVKAGDPVYGQGYVYFGPTLESFFPSFDDAIVRADNPGYWIQGPWVDTYPSNGGFINITGYTDAPVGTTICKSGITTKLTCGYINVKNETLTLSSGETIYGETRHSACVEPGDSGGANFSLNGSLYSAEGVTSAASLIGGRCLQVYGYQNMSWYFPFANSIAYYGWKYGVTLW